MTDKFFRFAKKNNLLCDDNNRKIFEIVCSDIISDILNFTKDLEDSGSWTTKGKKIADVSDISNKLKKYLEKNY